MINAAFRKELLDTDIACGDKEVSKFKNSH
jgi:hypothetical protein